MPEELLCPDCGGVVGATQTTDRGRPCTCFAGMNLSHGSSLAGQTVDGANQPPPPPVPKICIVCGKDVSGHRRVKDARGYTCYDCAKAEIKKERGGRVRCRSCGKLTKESALEEYEGTRMCPRCMAERKRLLKQEIKRIGIAKVHRRFELNRLMVLLAIAGVLLLIIVLHLLNVL